MQEIDMKANSLVPSGNNSDLIVDTLIDVVSKNGVCIQEILNSDSKAFSAEDLKYLPACFWGRIPSYAVFMKKIRSECPDLELALKELEAEALGGAYEDGMRKIYETPTSEMDGTEGKRFAWGEKLYRIQERKLDRIAKRRGEEDVEKGVDLAVRVISALSNAQLLKAKEIMEAEWKSEE